MFLSSHQRVIVQYRQIVFIDDNGERFTLNEEQFLNFNDIVHAWPALHDGYYPLGHNIWFCAHTLTFLAHKPISRFHFQRRSWKTYLSGVHDKLMSDAMCQGNQYYARH